MSESSQTSLVIRARLFLMRAKLANQDDAYFKAMRARDARFDGKFFVGVKTTGVYCRPICPAQPLRKNVEFLDSRIAAERKGYRPCLRCRPESAPLSSAWTGTSAVVQRALRAIEDQSATAHLDEDQFAERFGVTARHLRRLFKDEIGKTPKQIWFDNRLNLARKLITETKLPMTEIALAAGFGSTRRFNDAFLKRFDRAPSGVRRSPLAASKGFTVTLSYRPPYNFSALLQFYRGHQVGQLEWFTDESMHRIFQLHGEVGEWSVSNDAKNSRLLVEIDFPNPAHLSAILERIRLLFDVDSDPLLIETAVKGDAKMKRILKRHAGIRLPSAWDPFEASISTILGQLVSVERGRELVANLIDLLGEEVVHNGKPIRLFPTPAAVAAADLTNLGTTKIRKKTLHAFSTAVASGALSLEPTQNIEEFVKKALAIYGVGPWTVSYIAMKALRHADAFPATDLILARALDLHSEETIAKMSPWRAYVATLLWLEYAGKLTKPKA